MRLSLDSIREFQEALRKKKQQLPQIAENIVKRVSEVGLENNYKSAEMLPIENNSKIVSGGIRTTDEKDTYKEFGTGIVGSDNPHVSEFLAKSGWIYMANPNRNYEKGWVYPKGDGSFGWTKGLKAQKKFYESMQRMEEALPVIAKEEFNR